VVTDSDAARATPSVPYEPPAASRARAGILLFAAPRAGGPPTANRPRRCAGRVKNDRAAG